MLEPHPTPLPSHFLISPSLTLSLASQRTSPLAIVIISIYVIIPLLLCTPPYVGPLEALLDASDAAERSNVYEAAVRNGSIRAPSMRASSIKGNSVRGNSARGNGIRGSSVKGNSARGNGVQGNNIRGGNFKEAGAQGGTLRSAKAAKGVSAPAANRGMHQDLENDLHPDNNWKGPSELPHTSPLCPVVALHGSLRAQAMHKMAAHLAAFAGG